MSPQIPSPGDGQRLSRRAALGLGTGSMTALALALTGCSTASSKTAPAAVGPPPDVRTTLAAYRAIAATEALARAVVLHQPRLRATAAPLVAMHRAHLTTLRQILPPAQARRVAREHTAAPRSAGLSSLATSERQLQDRLATLAYDARSGELARLLAAMSAATAQRIPGLSR